MKTIKISLQILIGLAVLALFVGLCAYLAGWSFTTATEHANAGGAGFSLDQSYYITPGSGTAQFAGQLNATTSVVFLETGDTASSTITGSLGRATSLDLNLLAIASSTSAKYQWAVYFSQDKVDWYCEDGSTLDSTISQTHGASCLTHYWTPGTTAQSLKNVTVNAAQAKYFRVDFGVSAANGSLFGTAIPKDVTPN